MWHSKSVCPVSIHTMYYSLCSRTYDQIDATDLLEELRSNTQQRATQILRRTVIKQFAHLEGAVSTLRFERVLNIIELDFNLLGLDWCASESSE